MDDPGNNTHMPPGFPLSDETVSAIVDEVYDELFASHLFGEYDFEALQEIVLVRVQQRIEEVIRQN